MTKYEHRAADPRLQYTYLALLVNKPSDISKMLEVTVSARSPYSLYRVELCTC